MQPVAINILICQQFAACGASIFFFLKGKNCTSLLSPEKNNILITISHIPDGTERWKSMQQILFAGFVRNTTDMNYWRGFRIMRIATTSRVLVRSLFVSFRSSWINSLPLETAIFVPTFGITAITAIERMFLRHVESESLPTHNALGTLVTCLRSKRTAVTRREILNSTPDRRCSVLCPF